MQEIINLSANHHEIPALMVEKHKLLQYATTTGGSITVS